MFSHASLVVLDHEFISKDRYHRSDKVHGRRLRPHTIGVKEPLKSFKSGNLT